MRSSSSSSSSSSSKLSATSSRTSSARWNVYGVFLKQRSPNPLRARRSGPKSIYCTGDGFKFQMSFAYSVMVRSLENFPERATFMMALLSHASGSAYNVANSR